MRLVQASSQRYDAVRELRHSDTGEPFYVWKFMPRLPQILLDCVIYLYPSANAARAGEAYGGTGFLAGIKSETHPDQDLVHLYAVTNRHVIKDPPSPVIRLNTLQGNTEVLELNSDDWIPHSDGDDVAATYLGYFDRNKYKYSCIMVDRTFLTKDVIEDNDIGIGDDVFTISRFISHGGVQRNEPSVRYGNISMMPSEPIEDYYGHSQKCFLVEVRSLRGSSGSPVFVWLRPFSNRQTKYLEALGENPSIEEIGRALKQGMWLLGIAFADVPYQEEVKKQIRDRSGVVVDERETDYVAYSNSGQMAVIPAWRVSDFLLNDERFAMTREANDKEWEEAKKRTPLRPTTQGQEEKGVLTRERFGTMLKRVSRKISPRDEGTKET